MIETPQNLILLTEADVARMRELVERVEVNNERQPDEFSF